MRVTLFSFYEYPRDNVCIVSNIEISVFRKTIRGNHLLVVLVLSSGARIIVKFVISKNII